MNFLSSKFAFFSKITRFPAFLLCFFFSIMLFPAIGRSETLSGIIKDKITGKPIEDVSIYLVKSRIKVSSTKEGIFSINTGKTGIDTLHCRHKKYLPSDVSVEIPGNIEILLSPDMQTLETIVVRAKKPTDIPPEKRTSASVNVIDKKSIPERAATLDEVLDREVGIDTRSLGGVGASSEISIRGSTTDQVSVYMDGVPLTAAGSGVSGLAFIPLSQIEKIEVYRGMSPGTFGAGAIGGVVNINTLSANHGAGVEASLSYGSFGTTHQSVISHFGKGKLRYLISAGRNASENDFRFYDDRGTTIDKTDDGWETRQNSDYESLKALAQAQYSDPSGHSFMSKLLMADTDRGVSGLGRRPALNSRLSSGMLLFQARHTYKKLVETQAWIMRDRNSFYDPDDEAGRRGRQDTEDKINVRGINTNITRLFGNTLFHLTLETKHENYDSKDEYESAVVPESYRNSFGSGIESETALFNGRLCLTPRVFVNIVKDKLTNTGILLANSTQISSSNVSRDVYTTSLGVRLLAAESLVFRLNGGRFPRIPEFKELFGDTGDIVGNTELKEEQGNNFDIGAHYSPAGNIFEADTSIFYRYAKDLIQRRNYGDYMISENIGKAEITGCESWFSAVVPRGFGKLKISVAYQNAKNRSDETVLMKRRYYGKFLPYHPLWKGASDLTVNIRKNLSATWETTYESECFKGPSNLSDEKLEQRTIHSVKLNISIVRNTGIVIEVDNITDNHAPDRWGYPKPGRGYYATINYGWKRENDTR